MASTNISLVLLGEIDLKSNILLLIEVVFNSLVQGGSEGIDVLRSTTQSKNLYAPKPAGYFFADIILLK